MKVLLRSTSNSIRLAGILALLVLCYLPVAAQMDPGSGVKPSEPAEKKAPAKMTTRPAKEIEAATTTNSADGSVPSEDTRPKTKTPADPMTSLRDQIDAAATPEEKADLQLKLVDQLVRSGKRNEARDQLGRMLAEDRFDPAGFYNIGNAFARLGDLDGAVVSYHKAIEQRKGRYSRALNNLGVVLMRRGDWDEAAVALLAALKLETFRYAEASYNLGRLYAAQGQTDLAIREWRRALKVDPNHILAAQAIARAGSEGEVKMLTDQPAAPSTQTTSQTAPARSSKENVKLPSPAQPLASPKVLTVDPVTYRQLQRAREAHEHGKDQEAIESYRSVISRMGGYFAPANLELSYLLIGMKQPNEALTYLKPVTGRDGTRYPISYYHLARIYESQNELLMAVDAYSMAATLYRGVNPQFLLDLSRVREKRGDYKGALAAMEEYLAAVQQQGIRPEWSEERMAFLRQKLSDSQAKQ